MIFTLLFCQYKYHRILFLYFSGSKRENKGESPRNAPDMQDYPTSFPNLLASNAPIPSENAYHMTMSQPMPADVTSQHGGSHLAPGLSPLLNYTCPICSAVYMSAEQLKRHMSSHGQGQFPCEICHKAFNTKASQKQHERVVHVSVKPYKCQICSKRLSTAQRLRSHTFSVHNEVVFHPGRNTPSHPGKHMPENHT